MGRYTGPKEKLERRIGQKLFLKGERSYSPKSAMVKKPYPPGMHGKTKMRRLSEFGAQLIAKQKVRLTYKLLGRQFKKYIKQALASRSKSPDALIASLEQRLDNVVFRSGLATARDTAKQLVTHGHITVNNKRVKVPSFNVRVGDTIGVYKKSLNNKYFSVILPQIIKKYNPPEWIKLDKDKISSKIVEMPSIEDSGIDINDIQMLIEFYSR